MKHLLPNTLCLRSGFPFILICLPLLLSIKPANKLEELLGALTPAQQLWLQQHPATSRVLEEIAGQHHWSEKKQADAIFDHFTAEADPILPAIETAQEVAILKILHPDWGLARLVFSAAWNVAKGQAHSLLDVVGLAPGLGEGADFVNGVFYLLEGNKAAATFSFAAMVPFVGWVSTGAKYAGKIVKTAAGFTAELKFVVNSKGVITFGNRSQLATVIGSKAGHQAHHIIPWSSNTHEVVQKAADSGKWHPNLAKNGKHLDLSVHNGFLTKKEHDIYNAKVEKALDDIFTRLNVNLSPQNAIQALEELAQSIRVQLSQGKKLDQISL